MINIVSRTKAVDSRLLRRLYRQLRVGFVLVGAASGFGGSLGQTSAEATVYLPTDAVLTDAKITDTKITDTKIIETGTFADAADVLYAENADAENSAAENNRSEDDAELSASDRLQQAEAIATEAIAIAQTATTASQWDAAVAYWLEAIALLQAVPPESPARTLAQRQLRSYLQQLQDAQQRAEQASPGSGLPSLGSDLFDAQIAGYLSYVAAVGTPDILIVGSSRALQGIDPRELQKALAAQGQADLKVFNFSVNGATAQVVEFVLNDLLPKPLPPIVVWGDGSRAFNEGRRDRTWESLLASPGYQTVRANAARASNASALPNQPPLNLSPSLPPSQPPNLPPQVTSTSPRLEVPSNLDVRGFSAVSDRFDPQTYYQQVARVDGQYDGAYAGFRLNGAQTDALDRLATSLQREGIQLMFVNLPLSDSYLDNFRLYYEQQFQSFLQTQSQQHGFEVVDLLTQWKNQPGLFADPSHINKDGAIAIARQLAQQPELINALTSTPPSEGTEPDSSASPDSRDLLELLRPAQTAPAQNESFRRPPPPIPPPPSLPN